MSCLKESQQLIPKLAYVLCVVYSLTYHIQKIAILTILQSSWATEFFFQYSYNKNLYFYLHYSQYIDGISARIRKDMHYFFRIILLR